MGRGTASKEDAGGLLKGDHCWRDPKLGYRPVTGIVHCLTGRTGDKGWEHSEEQALRWLDVSVLEGCGTEAGRR